MRRVIISDPGDEQTHLFSPASVEPKQCATCKAIRGRDVCRYELEAFGNKGRPRTCLLRYDPSTAEVPY